jgi:hypothetical protein
VHGRLLLQPRQIGPKKLDQLAVLLDKVDTRSATRQGLEAERTGSGKQVEDTRALDPGRQPVEQGLAHTVRSGPQSVAIRHINPRTAQRTRNDANAPALVPAHSSVST